MLRGCHTLFQKLEFPRATILILPWSLSYVLLISTACCDEYIKVYNVYPVRDIMTPMHIV